MKRASILLSTVLFSTACLGVPKWASDSYKKNGNIVEVVCIGKGPSLDHGRLAAANNCLSSISREFSTQSKVNTFSMETLNETYLQHTVQSSTVLQNVVCDVLKEEFEEHDDQFTVYRKCQFDLSKAKATKNTSESNTEAVKNNEGSHVGSQSNSPREKVQPSQAQKILSVASSPKCDFIVIGSSQLSTSCTDNPQVVEVSVDEDSIEIKKAGYLPKIIKLKKGQLNEEVNVILDSI